MTRENAILCLKGIKNYGRDTFTEQSDWQDSLDMAIKALEQKPRKGHWIDTGWISECSCCHESSFPFDDSGYGSIYHNFCPNCGADMRGEE